MTDNFMFWLVKYLPKRLIYFCAIAVAVHGTTGEYSDTVTPELTFTEGLKRYFNDHNLKSN